MTHPPDRLDLKVDGRHRAAHATTQRLKAPNDGSRSASAQEVAITQALLLILLAQVVARLQRRITGRVDGSISSILAHTLQLIRRIDNLNT
jgi:hypothetical protein